ncbi:S-methyl-5-thioribose-1-phosphate isomerase [Caldisericum exile]|uniref:Methylthioribose-1-phosphate isomerase n=1 Tax=Caldisericum exile (strain DSM 21853 / NBRC 104410 / AZM16c01) TaxID=511051 RepID=A0A7U6GEU7_CALEA|nr:S-methyl-5-thioribose-1-phosphate isomerase [Caldisericum exile]BAL81107.1 methylthioribose-1-phosphate isomerase [Caldisericum exile AZM16c01]
MEIRSLYFDGSILHILDQRYLPFEVIDVQCKTECDVWEAINKMKIRGAPAIGVAAAYGMYLGLRNFEGSTETFIQKAKELKDYLDSARPTAVNLAWATKRILDKILSNGEKSPEELKQIALIEAKNIENEDIERNFKIGEFGSELFTDGDTIMTICNTGELATIKHGTAFSVIKRSFEKYKNISVIALETRPYLQGARLTAFELKEAGIPFRLITDNMAAFVMQKGLVSGIVTGADRIASNGDTANKVGTYMLAVLAHYHKIPFYVAAPLSTIDLNIESGKEIPIEERNSDEVTHCMGQRIAPNGVEVYNFSFDVTPHELITGIITDKGIAYPPFKKSIKKLFEF